MTPAPPAARILVVDDDPGMVRAVTRVLGRLYAVHAVTSPAAAIEHAAEHHVDVAILDIRMPEKDGFSVMQELLAQRADLDVILMTGNAAAPEAHLVRAIEHGAFYFIQKPFDRRVLLTLVARCLQLRRLQRERQLHLERLEQELDEARRFQASMLPAPDNTINGIQIRAQYQACTELAGDFYDYAATPHDGLAFVVADVSGHGASAAMLTGLVKAAFQAASGDGFEPLAIIERVSEGMRTFDHRRFITLFCARMEGPSPTLTFVNAGHPPAIVHGANGVTMLESTGPLVSPIFHLPFEQRTIELRPDDEVLVYTDGLLEAAGSEGAFGQDRLRAIIEADPGGGRALIDRIIAGVATHTDHRPWEDDITMVTVRRLPSPDS